MSKIYIFRTIKVFWYFKKFHYLILGYSFVICLFSIYLVGAIHFDFVENDLKIEEVNYSNSLKEEVHTIIDITVQNKDFESLDKKWAMYKNRMLLMIQDYYNFQMYYDSHEKYKFIVPKKRLEFYIKNESGKVYEVSIYSIQKKKWNSVYKHWLKYFNRSIKPSSKYWYLTTWLLISYPNIFFLFLLYSGKRKIQKFVRRENIPNAK